ncbi:MAG TPA: HAMP domain-containing sensor histidine kinase, partial [Candidatus Limiplasma sp.]|nr:HAMP domain-containing sensor histidine kinase [Candidatus Limiplasma sp.]
RVFSTFRFSLTLRIAVHSSLQLLRTAVMILLIFTIAFIIAQFPMINRTFDMLDALTPANGDCFTSEQINNSAILQAYYIQAPYTDDIQGFLDKVKLTGSELVHSKVTALYVYRNTLNGGLIIVFGMEDWVHVYLVCLIGLAAMDLYRILYFLHHRRRLNKHVLKPIADMTEAAENLSANNLSDRISLAGTKNEFKDLAAVINGMLDRIERSYNSQKQFVSDASHELRTPIAVIQGYANMLERWGKTDTSVLDEGIAAISQETASMKELVERLLFLARHDKKTLLLEMEVFDPTEIMFTVFRDAQLLSAAHKFELKADQHCLINGDKGMLKQLLRILVDNAMKYTPSGGKITIALKADAVDCVISVQDNGQGISKEELTRIFDRFYRSDKARKVQSGGHGLGLSIARIIVAAHSGVITVRSKEDAGTTFFVRLPLAAQNT